MHSGAACANGPGRLRGLPTPKTWREASRIGDFVESHRPFVGRGPNEWAGCLGRVSQRPHRCGV